LNSYYHNSTNITHDLRVQIAMENTKTTHSVAMATSKQHSHKSLRLRIQGTYACNNGEKTQSVIDD
jgi:hypothetical protein